MQEIVFTPAPGYGCPCTSSPCSVLKAGWVLNDPVYGPVSMTMSDDGFSWTGTNVISFPGGPLACGGGSSPQCEPATVEVRYEVDCDIEGGSLFIFSVDYPGFGLVVGDGNVVSCPGTGIQSGCSAATSSVIISLCPFEFQAEFFGMTNPCPESSLCVLYPNNTILTLTSP